MSWEPENVTAWLYCFAGWLSARDESITIGAREHAGEIAELIEQFADEHKLQACQWSKEKGAEPLVESGCET